MDRKEGYGVFTYATPAGQQFSGLYRQDEREGPGLLSYPCLLYTSPSPRDGLLSRMPSSA